MTLKRRSFLQQLGVTVGSAFVMSGRASAGQVPDSDHRKTQRSHFEPVEPPVPSGLTDSDLGSSRDPVGRGRGSSSVGIVDSDSGATADPVGLGRGNPGITDADAANMADPGGEGRGPARNYRNGITDADTGPTEDPANFGRGPRNHRRYSITDRDSGPTADPVGMGRGGSAE